MFESLKTSLRARALKKAASAVPTGIVPLGRVHSAVVFLPAGAEDSDRCAAGVLSFFKRKGIAVTVYALASSKGISAPEGTVLIAPRHLNFYGRLRRSRRVPAVVAGVDLFISLLDGDPFCVQYEAVRSGAAFKAGRVQLPGDVYDLVVNAPDSETCAPSEAFTEMTALMEKIK